jgi:hypothetical protein
MEQEWINQTSVGFEHVIDNGVGVKFVSHLIFHGIDLDFSTGCLAYVIVNGFAR